MNTETSGTVTPSVVHFVEPLKRYGFLTSLIKKESMSVKHQFGYKRCEYQFVNFHIS